MPSDRDEIQERCDALLGQVIGGRYRLDAVLGMGAMGAVFRAHHTGLARDVALKLLHEDLMASEEMRARFAREAAAVSKLDHPNCVRVSDFGSDGSHQYLVMELLQGESLTDLADDERLPPRQALQIADEVLAGLEHAHGHGLVHRDIKPDNVFMVREEGGRFRVKLLDFGIVKLQEQEGARPLTKLGMIFGTPCYMSPEQATGGSVDARTDLYSVGIVLYLLLAGRLPFDGEDPLKVLRQQIRDPPPPLPADVPEPLREVVMRLLAKQPDGRYATATAAREALAQVRPQLEPAARATATLVAGLPMPPPSAAPPGLPVPPPSAAPSVAVPPPAAAPPVAVAPPVSPAAIPGQAPSVAPPTPGPMIVVPSHARPWWPPAWWPLGLDVRWVAGGLGALVLLVIVVVATSGDEPPQSPPATEPAADAARDELARRLGGKAPADAPEPASPETKDGASEAGEGDDEAAPPTEAAGPDRTLQASIASVDALVEARELEAARITLGHLLEAHPQQAQLHLRMAQVYVALGGAENRALALESYAAAIAADPGLLDDETFMPPLWALMDDPKLRASAVDLALERLGTRADERLLQWLNQQSAPLGHAARERIIAHLQAQGRSDAINRPLQRALDLWQAPRAEDPCGTFTAALAQASESPDSFLVGTLRVVPVPQAPAAEGQEPQPCPGAAERLAEVRARYDAMFEGIEPVVPKAYRKRPVAKSSASQSSRRSRRR